VTVSSLIPGPPEPADDARRPSEGARLAISVWPAADGNVSSALADDANALAAREAAADEGRPGAGGAGDDSEADASARRYALAALEDVGARANSYPSNSKSPATIRAYAAGWRDFLQFCQLHGAEPLPATERTVAAYLAALADRGAKAATIARRLVVISQAHKAADLPSPTTSSLVSRTHAAIRRTIGTAQTAKSPALVEDLKRMLAHLPATRVGMRDRALLLLGFAGGFRRSELVALDVADLEFSSDGLIITVRRAKTDQDGRSSRIGVPFGSSERTCPVRSVQAWLAAARIADGAVFRSLDRFQRVQPRRLSDKAVARVIKRRAAAVGLDPDRYAGHSLRAGLAMSAAAGGASERDIMNQTGHRSAGMVRRYVREGNLFNKSNAASLAGL
jgi:integrase